jgi:hypothetical protein
MDEKELKKQIDELLIQYNDDGIIPCISLDDIRKKLQELVRDNITPSFPDIEVKTREEDGVNVYDIKITGLLSYLDEE